MKVTAPPISFERVRRQALGAMRGQPRVVLVTEDASTPDIVNRVRYVTHHYGHQVNTWARLLKADTPEETLARVFAFIQWAVVYELDPDGLQAALSPQAALLRARGDCKTYAILGASLLDALGFAVRFRFVQFRKADLEHVYLVVRHGGRDLAFDPCLKRLGDEKPFTRNQDYPVTRLIQIAGVGSASQVPAPIMPSSPSMRAFLRARERAYSNPNGIGCPSVSRAPLYGPISGPGVGALPIFAAIAKGFASAKTFIAANPEAMGMIDDKLKSIPVVGEILSKIFGPCGWFAGWDAISQAQLQRVNANKRYIGEPEIVGEEPVCNWRQTIHQDRVAIELAAENKALQVQFRERFGDEGLVMLLADTYKLYDDYINRRDPSGSMGRMRDLREHYLNQWEQQSRGQRGGFTVEQWLYNDALRITAQHKYGFSYVPNQPKPASAGSGSAWGELENSIKNKVGLDNSTGDATWLAAAGVLLLAIVS